MAPDINTLDSPHWLSDTSSAATSPPAIPPSTASQLKAGASKSSLLKHLGQREYERDILVRKCAGRKIHVVNLMSLMPAWPKDIHSQEILDEINVEVDEWLKT